MRPLVAALLVLASSSVQGCCCVGSVSRWDGEGPIRGSALERVHWDELVAGEGGSLLVRRGSSTELLAVAPGSMTFVSLERQVPFAGAHVAGGLLYRPTKEGIARSPVDDPERSETIARIESARLVAASGETLLVAQPGAVVLVRHGFASTVWKGQALALALDAPRGAAWIASREPLAVVDLVDLDRGSVVLRVPLPEELWSANLRIVLSGKVAAVYAHDRPLESALLVAPDAGRAWRFTVDGQRGAPGQLVEDACPRLLIPEGEVPPGARSYGRIAPLPGERFVVACLSGDRTSARVTVVGVGGARPGPPTARMLATPTGWPGVIAGVTWSRDGVWVSVDANRRLHVTSDLEVEVGTPHEAGRVIRHGLNYAINAPIAVTEVAVSLALGVPLGCLVAPFGVPLLLAEPRAGLLALVAPFWFPFVRM